jgi:hypothetical protein
MTIRPTQSELALLFVHIRDVAAVTPYRVRVDIERLRELLRAKRDERDCNPCQDG